MREAVCGTDKATPGIGHPSRVRNDGAGCEREADDMEEAFSVPGRAMPPEARPAGRGERRANIHLGRGRQEDGFEAPVAPSESSGGRGVHQTQRAARRPEARDGVRGGPVPEHRGVLVELRERWERSRGNCNCYVNGRHLYAGVQVLRR